MSSSNSNRHPKNVLGIDLGTVSARARLYDHDKLVVDEPCYVYVESASRFLVGEPAKQRLALNPTRTVSGAFKQLVGRSYAEAEHPARTWPFDVVNHHERPVIEVSDDGTNALTIAPNELYAVVLAEMKNCSERHLKIPVTDCIVTVPVCFNFKQRLAVREAAAKASMQTNS